MKLKKLRKIKGLNQSELGEIFGISQKMISSYELGIAKPDYTTLVRFADFFNVSLDYLVGRQFGNYVDKATLTENQRKLFEFMLEYDDDMNEDFLNVLYGYVSRIEPKNQEIYKRKYE